MTLRLGLDTNIVLYALIRDSQWHEVAADLLRGRSGGELWASELIIAELLSHDSVKAKLEYDKVDGLIRSGVFTLIPVSSAVLYRAAEIRREHHLNLADAIHLAGAIHAKATHFVTNDVDLLGQPMQGLRLVGPEEALSLGSEK
jgi:predicted nucleic acid-binding protein